MEITPFTSEPYEIRTTLEITIFKTNNNEYLSTLAHEGYPGHLYQNVYFKNQDVNLFFGGYYEYFKN